MIDHGDDMLIRIIDNGMGIKKESHGEVFEMFRTGRGDPGTGLGLAVSRRIVENHSGKITVESEENDGTIFTVKRPARHQESGTGDVNKTK